MPTPDRNDDRSVNADTGGFMNTTESQSVNEATNTPANTATNGEAPPVVNGKVIPLRKSAHPAEDTGHEPADETPPVLEGELLSDEDSAALDLRMAASRALVRFPAQAVTVVWRHEHTARLRSVAAYRVRKAPADAGRLTWFCVRGHGRFIARGWRWASHADLRADADRARVAGDHEARRLAQLAMREDARARWIKIGHTLRITGIVLCVVTVVGVTLAIVDASMARVEMPAWLATVFEALDFLGSLLPSLPPVALAGWLVAATHEGRDKTPGVGWLTAPNRDDADSWIDERMISQALAHLAIPPLDKFFKNGGQLTYTVAARVDGDGTFAQVKLPMGVTADMIADRRPKLAANLGRAKLETWPTEGDEAGVLDLWVADKGKLGGGAGPWPLLADGQVDAFAGVPFGITQRGTVINAMLFEANWLIGGRPGQGKSAAMRTLLLGAALDPTTELWVFVMGQSPDFKPFAPRLSRYHMGMDDSVAEAAVQGLRDLLVEMERRGKVLDGLPGNPPKTSRRLADQPGLGLHLLVCAIDECHELFQHPKFGAEAEELAVRLIKRGRKYGICLILATQSPTKESLPKEVTRNVSCGVAFAVADHVANDGLLGSGKYRQGIRATELRMKTDRGTCVAVGVTDATFELVRTFYVPFDDETDQVTPVIARAMALLDDAGRQLAQTSTEPEAPAVDQLADIHAVMRSERRVRTAVVLGRLAEHNHREYGDWTAQDLKAALGGHGIDVAKSNGHSVIRAEDVTTALTERDNEDDAETGS